MIGLDTNILLRWLVEESAWPEQDRGQIRAVRGLVLGSRETFFVNHIVLAETIWVLANRMDQPKTLLLEIMDRLLASANLVIDRREAVAAAAASFRTGKAGFTDYLIGHVNRHAGCETTMSFDKDAARSDIFRRPEPRSA